MELHSTHEPKYLAGQKPAILAVTGLKKSFGERHVLKDVHFSAHNGEALALIGANGSGKSTLLRSIVRLVEPDRGSIEALGQPVLSLNRAGLKNYRSRVGFVFQKHNLVGRLSVLTNVIHGVQGRASGFRTWSHSLAKDEWRQEAMQCLMAVGLEDRALQRADSLSGGQSQRVAIARMLMQRPELVLADEPDASLDPKSGEEVMGLLYGLTKDKGLALIVISHRVEHTIRFSDRIIGLSDGIVHFDQCSKDVAPKNLISFFQDGEMAA
jgi:phosphonate transport system ATP-binding protein